MLYSSFRWPSAEVLGQLVREAHEGRASAVEELLTVLRPLLLAFFQRRHSFDNAEDLTQLAMIRIAGAIDRIDPVRADSYISTVARNLLRTAYKASAKERSRKSDVDALDLPANTMDVDRRAELEDLTLAVHRACLEKLGAGLREVAVGMLRGDSAAEIGESLHISPVTVRTRLMRIRAVMRTELACYVNAER